MIYELNQHEFVHKDGQAVRLINLTIYENYMELKGERDDGESISTRITIDDEAMKLYSLNKKELFTDIYNWLCTFSNMCSPKCQMEMQEVKKVS